MAAFGIKVLCIEPGFFKTNVTDTGIQIKNLNTLWDRLPQDLKDEYGSDYVPNCKTGSPLVRVVQFDSFLICVLLAATKVIKEKVAKISDADLMKVVGCMEHAVSAVWPRKRYSPGWDAKFFWLPLSYLPSCVADYLLLKEAIPIAKRVR